MLRITFSGGATATRLQVASLPIKDQTTCAEAYASQRNSRIDGRVLCAGEAGVDTCQVHVAKILKYSPADDQWMGNRYGNVAILLE